MRVRLYLVDGCVNHEPIVLDALPIIIGSSPADDLVLEGIGLEECHCELSCADKTIMIRDLGSERGTFVNDVSVVSAPIMPGDKIKLGNSCFVVSYEGSPAAQYTETICRVDTVNTKEHFVWHSLAHYN